MTFRVNGTTPSHQADNLFLDEALALCLLQLPSLYPFGKELMKLEQWPENEAQVRNLFIKNLLGEQHHAEK